MAGVLFVQIGYASVIDIKWGVVAKEFEQIRVWGFQGHLRLQHWAEWTSVHYRHVSALLMLSYHILILVLAAWEVC
jgi:hypothetical protein